MSDYLTVNQVADALHVSSTTVRRWIYQGDLRAKKVKTGRNARVLIDKNEVEGLLSPMGQQSPDHSGKDRRAAVEAVLALQRQFAGRGIDVDALISHNRQEREHA